MAAPRDRRVDRRSPPARCAGALLLRDRAVQGGRYPGPRKPAHHDHCAIRSHRFSRNPIYLAFSLLVAAIACWANSIWLLGTLATAAGVMHFVVIPREEHYLERRFGAEYLTYKAQVRRWL